MPSRVIRIIPTARPLGEARRSQAVGTLDLMDYGHLDPVAAEVVGSFHPTDSWRTFDAVAKVPASLAFAQSRGRLLVALRAEGASTRRADQALAWGLAYCGDRELVLCFPDARLADGARARLWAFSVQARIIVRTADGGVTEVLAYPRSERLARVCEKDAGGTDTARALRIDAPALPEWADLGGIAHWAEEQGAARADRHSYLAWHFDGRKVVQLRVRGDKVLLSAGVHTGSHPELFGLGAAAPAEAVGSGEELTAAWTRLRPVAEAAIAARKAGTDAWNREHKFQAHLAAQWGLGFDRRELPARRPYGGSGYIDLLRTDGGSIDVVETKLGFDECLLLQGIDYVVWAEANADLLARHFGLRDPRVSLSLVVGDATTSGPLLARWAGQRQHVSPDLAVTWTEVQDWEVGA